MLDNLILKPAFPVVIALAFAMALVTGKATLYSLSGSQITGQSSSSTQKANAPAVKAVTALGRLEPEGEVIQLSAPASTERVRVEKLLVKEGDKIHSGQVVAILDNYNRLQVALKQAQQQVKISQARLAQVKAGAKSGEIVAQRAEIARILAESRGQVAAQEANIARLLAASRGEITAQKATVARLLAESRNAEAEYRRYQNLYRQGAISASTFDSKRLSVATIREQMNEARANLDRIVKTNSEQINEAKVNLDRIVKTSAEQTNEAKATLHRIAEVRTVDVQQAQAEVDGATTAVEQAQANLDMVYVRSPINSQVLKIHTWPGEIASDEGIIDLGRTDQMYVIAEVYETDVGKLRKGQPATIISDAFSGELQGTVNHIGLQINKKDVLDTDPAADVDARVVEVKIRLSPEDSQRVAALSRLQVKVAIKIQDT